MPLPTVSVPIGLLFSPFKTWIEKFFLFETYLTSHREYLKRDGFLVRWEAIGPGLEVSLSLPSILENDRAPMPQLALRKTSSDSPLDRIRLLVEAESPIGIFQETVTLFHVGMKPVITSLPSIPLRTFIVSEDMKFIESMNQFRIFILEIGSSPVQSVLTSKSAFSTSPNTIDLLNERFEERWGTYWNMAAVDFAIRDKSHWFTYHLVSPKVLYGSSSEIPISAHVKAIFRTFVGRPLCWLLTRQWLLRAYFWIPILVFRQKFSVNNG